MYCLVIVIILFSRDNREQAPTFYHKHYRKKQDQICHSYLTMQQSQNVFTYLNEAVSLHPEHLNGCLIFRENSKKIY